MQPQQSYGNPLIEQRELSSGTAVVLFDPVAIVTVSGEDRLKWLHSLLSQNLQDFMPGDSAEALLLDPQGHIEQIIHLIEDGERCWLIVDRERGEQLKTWLNSMIFRMKVKVEDQSENFRIVGATKVTAGLASESNGTPLIWQDAWPNKTAGGYRYSSRPSEYQFVEHLVVAEEVDKRLASHSLAGSSAYEALRIAAGRPSWREVDEKTLPHELDLLTTAVHLSKGCYRGQESVAKIHNLGHPPRRLTLLHLDGTNLDLPGQGSEIRLVGQEKVIGKVTSAQQHFEMGPIALALLQRGVPEDAELEITFAGSVQRASQEVLVPASAGSVADIPKLPRLSLSKAKGLGSPR